MKAVNISPVVLHRSSPAASVERRPITSRTTRWSPELNIIPPIDPRQIPHFKCWINWNGFSREHIGLDFAAYLDDVGRIILGLPARIEIKAVADGVVALVWGPGGPLPYGNYVYLEHGRKKGGLLSTYHHVVPLVEDNQEVKQGETIATLYKDPGKKSGKLVHLHFSFENSWKEPERQIVDPAHLFPGLMPLDAEPQGEAQFKISQLKDKPPIVAANFKEVLVHCP